jgi:hypothetical protein
MSNCHGAKLYIKNKAHLLHRIKSVKGSINLHYIKDISIPKNRIIYPYNVSLYHQLLGLQVALFAVNNLFGFFNKLANVV